MTYTLRIDQRGREVLLNALRIIKSAAEEEILSGNVETGVITQHEELLQLHRGILYLRPDPEPQVEEPVVGPEAGINKTSEVDNVPN